MKHIDVRLILGNIVYALTVLLVFLTFFENLIQFPALVQWTGRWHPLVLHFPLVLVFITIIQYWRRDRYAHWYLAAATLFALFSALSGMILSAESETKGNTILLHQWFGTSITILLVIWFFLENRIKGISLKILQAMLAIMIIITGHFGGMVTHGSDFLTLNKSKSNSIKALPENPNIFVDLVQPAFQMKCVKCHGENKAKGKLKLNGFEEIMSGGESGAMTPSGEYRVMYHIGLPVEHEDHMPPKDEKQLSNEEMIILQSWFDLGAKPDLHLYDIDENSELASLINERKKNSEISRWIGLPDISESQLEKLTTDYFTLRKLYAGSNAVEVLVYPHQPFDSKNFHNLRKIEKNIVYLHLNNLALTANEFKTIRQFQNLQTLNIGNCHFAPEDLGQLGQMQGLRVLKAYNTSLNDASAEIISGFPALEHVYIYSTSISEEGHKKLKSLNPNLTLITKAPEADDFDALLPAPKLEPLKYFFCEPFYLKPTHPLQNVRFNYSSDAENTLSQSFEIGDSLLVDASTILKYKVTKTGWSPGTEDSMVFLKSCVVPDSLYLENQPNEKYKGKGINTLFDMQKGPLDFNDAAWMGFTEKTFTLHCFFNQAVELSVVQLSSLVNTDPYLFPPSRIQVFGRSDNEKLKLLGTSETNIPQEPMEARFMYYALQLSGEPIRHLKIVAEPLSKIPIWHQGKDKPAWFFIDEVILSAE